MICKLDNYYDFCKINGFKDKPIHSFLSFFKKELNSSKTFSKEKLVLAQKMEFICNEKLKYQKLHSCRTFFGNVVSCIRNLIKYGKCQNSAQIGKELAADFIKNYDRAALKIQKWFKSQKKIKEKLIKYTNASNAQNAANDQVIPTTEENRKEPNSDFIKNASALKIQKWFKNRKKIKDDLAEKFIKGNFTVVASNVQRITDAQAVCIAETHDKNVKEISSVFNLLYKKVDVAFSELGDVTVNPSIENGSFTLDTPYKEYLQKSVKFKCWDHPSKNKISAIYLFNSLYEDMLKFKNSSFNYNQFYFKYQNLFSVVNQKQIEKLIRVYEAENSNFRMAGLVETFIIITLFHLLYSRMMKDVHDNSQKRNMSLCNSIDDAFIDMSNKCKKVFLICGFKHVMNVDPENQGVDLVNDCFKRRKYIILRPIEKSERSSFDSFNFRYIKIADYVKENQFLLENALNAINDQPPISKEDFDSSNIRRGVEIT